MHIEFLSDASVTIPLELGGRLGARSEGRLGMVEGSLGGRCTAISWRALLTAASSFIWFMMAVLGSEEGPKAILLFIESIFMSSIGGDLEATWRETGAPVDLGARV